jgi:hypothetical protein
VNASSTNAQLTQVQTAQNTTGKTEGETKLPAEGSSTVRVSPDGDTIEISEQGMCKAQSSTVAPSSNASASTEKSVTSETTSAEEEAVKTIISEYTDETDETDNLSQYTKSELSEMLAEGTISRAEYDAEIKRREGDTDSSEDDNSVKQKEDIAESVDYLV